MVVFVVVVCVVSMCVCVPSFSNHYCVLAGRRGRGGETGRSAATGPTGVTSPPCNADPMLRESTFVTLLQVAADSVICAERLS